MPTVSEADRVDSRPQRGTQVAMPIVLIVNSASARRS